MTAWYGRRSKRARPIRTSAAWGSPPSPAPMEFSKAQLSWIWLYLAIRYSSLIKFSITYTPSFYTQSTQVPRKLPLLYPEHWSLPRLLEGPHHRVVHIIAVFCPDTLVFWYLINQSHYRVSHEFYFLFGRIKYLLTKICISYQTHRKSYITKMKYLVHSADQMLLQS